MGPWQKLNVMDSFSHFALMASIGVIIILLWRLNVAIRVQSELATSITTQTDSMADDRQAADDQVEQLTAANQQLTHANEFLNRDLEQQQFAFEQVQSDQLALQIKYRELEKELLSTMTQQTILSEQLQDEQLDKANLQRRLETLQEKQLTQNMSFQDVQAELSTLKDKSKLYQQAVQAARDRVIDPHPARHANPLTFSNVDGRRLDPNRWRLNDDVTGLRRLRDNANAQTMLSSFRLTR